MAEKQTLNTSALLNWIKQYVSAVDIEKAFGTNSYQGTKNNKSKDIVFRQVVLPSRN